MRFELRWYQEECVSSIFDYFRSGQKGNPICALPTGTGKSLVIADFIERALKMYQSTRILMLTHNKKIIEQNAKALKRQWGNAPLGICCAGLNNEQTDRQVTFGSIQTVANRGEHFMDVDLVLVDECHLVSTNENTRYRTLINDMLEKNPNVKVIGFTATPYRLDSGMLIDSGNPDSLFTDLCYNLTKPSDFARLIAEGHLSALVAKKAQEQLDVSGVKSRGGDFIMAELQKAVSQGNTTRLALQELVREGENRSHWLIFSSGIHHANTIVVILNEMGINAVSVHSRMTESERAENIRAFTAGEVRALVNMNILTTGFDYPEIDLIGVLRPTESAALWVQMLGRGTRPADGKLNCRVLDFAGNTERLGPINAPNILVNQREEDGEPSDGSEAIKPCPNCGNFCSTIYMVCPECQWQFPLEVSIEAKATSRSPMAQLTDPPEVFEVSSVSYMKHIPRNSNPPSLKVTYTCGLRRFNEWHCFEHQGYARTKAVSWWGMVAPYDYPIPNTIEEAMTYHEGLLEPNRITVTLGQKYPKIENRDFSAPSGGIPF